jgi:signal transduction histidine kinase
MFDWRQLMRWEIPEANLPPGSIVRYRQPGLWDQYKWHLGGVTSLCALQALLIIYMVRRRLRLAPVERRLRQKQAELQELTGRLLEAQETERRRIARDLHDDLGQNLALLSVEMDLLRKKSPQSRGQPDPLVEAMSDQLKQLSSSVHDLSHQLHPMKLEQLGLEAAVKGLCKELSAIHGLSIDFAHDPAPQTIPQDIALCLYRIAQEALRNVIKHSHARHAIVELRHPPEAIHLRVRDDGIGFDPVSVADRGGLGLASMRERLRLVDGEITLESGNSHGTLIEARVPLCSNKP